MTTVEVSGLRNTPTWRGYLVGWMACVWTFLLGAFVAVTIGEGDLDWEGLPASLLMVLFYFLAVTVASGIGLVPVAVVLHVAMRGVTGQWKHVAAFGIAISLAYGVAAATAEPLLGFLGLVPGAAAAVGRLAVAGPRWRQPRRVRVRTGW